MSTDEEIEQFALSRVGTMINGKWTLDRLIGVGGMAAVYAATHRNTKRAALKILHPEFAAQEGIQKRFLREGYVANMIGHSAVATVDDDDVTEDGCAFLVMELVEGETLEARVRRKGPLPPAEVLSFMDQVLHVVATAHGKGIVHRDLKPENLLLSQDGQVKLLDFGIARIRQLSSDPTKTLTEGLMGTPAFMPPEQARGRWAEVDAQSDVWSVGATMFTLLTGRYVHEAQTMNEALAMAMMQRAPLVENYRPELPPYVCDLVNRALIFEKNERWPNATVMLLAVRKAAARLDEEEMQASAQEAARAVQVDSADPEILIGVEDDTGHEDFTEAAEELPPSEPSAAAMEPPEPENESAPLASLLGKPAQSTPAVPTGEAVIEAASLPRTEIESSPKHLAVTTQLSSEEVDALQRAADERSLDPYPSEPSRPSQPSILEEELTAVMQRPDLAQDDDAPRSKPATETAAERPQLVERIRPAAGSPARSTPEPSAPQPSAPEPSAPEPGVHQPRAPEAVTPASSKPPAPQEPALAESKSAVEFADTAEMAAASKDDATTSKAEDETASASDRTSDELPTSVRASEKPLSVDEAEAPAEPPKDSRRPAGGRRPRPGKEPDRAGLVAIALAATGRAAPGEPPSAGSRPPPSSAGTERSSASAAQDLPKSKILPVPDVPSDGERISRTVHTTTARAALSALPNFAFLPNFTALPKQVKARALATIGAVLGLILLIVVITLSGDDDVPTPGAAGVPAARSDVLLEPIPDHSAGTAPKATASASERPAPSEAVDLEELPVLPNQQIQRRWTPPPKKKETKSGENTNPFARYTDIAKKQAEKRKLQK